VKSVDEAKMIAPKPLIIDDLLLFFNPKENYEPPVTGIII